MANPSKLIGIAIVLYSVSSKIVFAQGPSDFDEIINKNITGGYSPTNFTYIYPEVDAWKPPKDLLTKYPFYLTGFDEGARPIWVMEWGKYDVKTVVTSPKDKKEVYNTYWKKMIRTMGKSEDMLSTVDNPVTQGNYIIDLDGLTLDQLSDRRTINYLLSLVQEHRETVFKHSYKIVVINTNAVALPFVNIARTVFGSLFERISLFGTNKAKWIPELLRLFPKEALPEWYGGNKDHKPLIVVG